ncbi:MAG: hypothetical protein V3V40_06315 [Nitrosomonadaceae bacterium]
MTAAIIQFPDRKARYYTWDIVDLMPAYMLMRPDGTYNDADKKFREAMKKYIRGIPQDGAEIINI